jgi:hypothetical protein
MDAGDLEQAAKVLKDIVPKIYEDLAQPGVRQLGRALESVIKFLAIPAEHLGYFGEKRRLCLANSLERYRQRLAEIPDQKVIEVAPEIGVPILEKLTYVENEDLSDLFLNLLATASNEDTVNLAHPGFFRVIEQLSPDEAKLLLFFSGTDCVPSHYQRLRHTATGEEKEFGSRYGKLRNASLDYPENLELYMCNLEGLSILRRRTMTGHDTAKFQQEMSSIYSELDAEFHATGWTDYDNVTEPGTPLIIETSAYGRMFIKACVSKKL